MQTAVGAVLTLDVKVRTGSEWPFAVFISERLRLPEFFRVRDDYSKMLMVFVAGGVWQDMHSAPSTSTGLR